MEQDQAVLQDFIQAKILTLKEDHNPDKLLVETKRDIQTVLQVLILQVNKDMWIGRPRIIMVITRYLKHKWQTTWMIQLECRIIQMQTHENLILIILPLGYIKQLMG